MLTVLVLNATMSGALVLGAPLVFGSLLALRYPDKVASSSGHTKTLAEMPPVPTKPNNIENLAAHRERKRVAPSGLQAA